MNEERSKYFEVLIIVYVISSIAFWSGLFFITPSYLTFAINEEKLDNAVLPKHVQTYVYNNENVDRDERFAASKTGMTVYFSIGLYGMLSLIFFIIGSQLSKNRYYYILMGVFISIVLVSKLYFIKYFEPYRGLTSISNGYHFSIVSLPVILFIYKNFEKIMKFTGLITVTHNNIKINSETDSVINMMFTLFIIGVGEIVGSVVVKYLY